MCDYLIFNIFFHLSSLVSCFARNSDIGATAGFLSLGSFDAGSWFLLI